MIKFARYAFEPTEGFSPYVNYMDFGKCIGFDVNYYETMESFDYNLNENMVYDISFDQSTTCCGITIKNCYNTELYLMEVKRDGKGQDAYQFMFDLEKLLQRMTNLTHVSRIMYEEPIISKNYRSSQVLFALEGFIKTLPRRYEQFSTATLDTVPNASWVSRVADKRYDMYDRKSMTMLSICDLFPWARMYGDSINKDNDVFDSIGVMNGWFRISYDEVGRPLVRGKEFTGNIGCYLLPNVDPKEICDSFTESGIKSKWAMYNPSLSTYENIGKSAEAGTVAFISTLDKHVILNLFVLAGWVYQELESLCVMIVTPNEIDKRVYEIAGKEFCFVF